MPYLPGQSRAAPSGLQLTEPRVKNGSLSTITSSFPIRLYNWMGLTQAHTRRSYLTPTQGRQVSVRTRRAQGKTLRATWRVRHKVAGIAESRQHSTYCSTRMIRCRAPIISLNNMRNVSGWNRSSPHFKFDYWCGFWPLSYNICIDHFEVHLFSTVEWRLLYCVIILFMHCYAHTKK